MTINRLFDVESLQITNFTNPMLANFYRLSLFIATLLISTMSHSEPTYYKDTETLPYSVIKTLTEDIEIRHYNQAVGVMSEGNEDTGAFNLLFNYISGENKGNSDISMTSPVEVGKGSQEIAMTSPVEVSSETMMFFLPSEYDAQSAPTPTNKNVSLVVVPERTVAAIRYSGFSSDSDKEEYTRELRKVLEENNIETVGLPSYMGYDSPFTLPWNKRHEIIIPVEAP